MLERCQQAEADDVEQRHRAAGHMIDAIALDHFLDDQRFRPLTAQRLAQWDANRLDAEQTRNLVELLQRQMPVAGNQARDKRLGRPPRH